MDKKYIVTEGWNNKGAVVASEPMQLFADTGEKSPVADSSAPKAAPGTSLSVVRNPISTPVAVTIGIISGIAILLLMYKYKPEWFRFFKPKA